MVSIKHELRPEHLLLPAICLCMNIHTFTFTYLYALLNLWLMNQTQPVPTLNDRAGCLPRL